MKSLKEFLAEAKYEVEVSVRDARKADNIARDQFRGTYKETGYSNTWVFKKKSDWEDFVVTLEDEGIEILSGGLDESKQINESKYKKEVAATKLKVGDVILYGPDDTPHEVMGKPKQDGTGYWVPVKNQANNKTDRIYIDSNDTVPLNEAITVNTDQKVTIKSGKDGMFVEKMKTGGVLFYVADGSDKAMYEAKGDELKAIKEFFSKL